jgi:hypothetical protein
MATTKEISEPKIIVTIKPKESIFTSLIKDCMTLGFLILCAYVSKGSRFWTLITGTLFLIFLWSSLIEKVKAFTDKDKAIQYINEHFKEPEENNNGKKN